MPNLTYQLDFGADLAGVRSAQAEMAKLKSSLGELAKIAGLAAIGESFRRGLSEGVRFNSKLEEIRRGLTAVRGSAGLAAAGLSELQRAEAKSTFDIAELGAVSRQMEIMTNGALSSGSGLQLLMDVAAGTAAPLTSVADALGRVYGQIQAGDPELGRGMQQLVMLGAINATTRNEIQALATAGASSASQWATLSAALGRFNGQAATAAGTLKGLKFQLGQAFEEALGGATEGLFGDLKAQMAALADSLRSGPAGAALKDLAGSLASVAGAFVRLSGFVLGSSAVLSTLATALKAMSFAWVGLKIVDAVQGLSAWIAGAWRGVTATTASTAALTAETRALAANAAARRVSNLSDRFAPARLPGRDTLLRDQVTGRFNSAANAGGTMRSTTYTAASLAETLAAQSSASGAKAGTSFASSFSAAFGLLKNNLGAVLATAFVGFSVGRALRGALTKDITQSDLDGAENLRASSSKRSTGLVEQIGALDSVAGKMNLLKNIEEEIAELRAKSGQDSTGEAERNVIASELVGLEAMRNKVRTMDEAVLKAKELARTQQDARGRNAPTFDATVDKMAREDQAARREQALATAGSGAGGPMAQLRLVRGYLAEAKTELGKLNLADTANPQYDKLIARAERLRDLIKEMTGKQISLTKDVSEGDRAKEQLALEIQILKLRTSGTAAEERAAERKLEISRKTAELLPMYDTASAAKAAATKFVDADLAAKAFRPSGEAMRPQGNNFDRAGLFVGGVANALQQKATDAVVQSRAILQQMYTFMRETKTTPATHWGHS